MIQDWSSITLGALQNLWQGFIKFIPQLIGALVIFVIGWFIAVWVGRFIAGILRKLKFDRIFEKGKWDETLAKANFKMKISEFIGGIIKWVLVIVFLLAAVEILGLGQFAGFLKSIVIWLPNLVVAVAIFIVAIIVADFSEKLVEAIVGKMKVGYSRFLGNLVKWAIWIFAILAILSQIGIASEIIQILVTGFVALIVISAGIAFGLGGRDLAKNILEKVRENIRD